jgi:hypothetical protein
VLFSVTAEAERSQVRHGERIAAVRNPDDVMNLELLGCTAGQAPSAVSLLRRCSRFLPAR